MRERFEEAIERLKERAEDYGVRMETRPLDVETPGKFDGPSITLNRDRDPETRCYFLVHSLASIVQWSVDFVDSRDVFAELREANAGRKADPERFVRALDRYRDLEVRISEYAVWLLAETGSEDLLPSYTSFARADLEAMVRFHSEGMAPVWEEFFAKWQRRVERGEQEVQPYRPRPVPPFHPVTIPEQRVVQEVDGRP